MKAVGATVALLCTHTFKEISSYSSFDKFVPSLIISSFIPDRACQGFVKLDKYSFAIV